MVSLLLPTLSPQAYFLSWRYQNTKISKPGAGEMAQQLRALLSRRGAEFDSKHPVLRKISCPFLTSGDCRQNIHIHKTSKSFKKANKYIFRIKDLNATHVPLHIVIFLIIKNYTCYRKYRPTTSVWRRYCNSLGIQTGSTALSPPF